MKLFEDIDTIPSSSLFSLPNSSLEYSEEASKNEFTILGGISLNKLLFLVECFRFFEYILLYKDGVMFQIEQVTKLCSKIALTEPWDPYDIPANSTYEDQYYIGGPGDQIMVQEWSDRKPARKSESWVGVYTVKDCYPVQETYTKNSSVTTSTRFFDLQLGIADPSVFTPPSTCQAAQMRRMDDVC
ncbi:PREDICTED: mammalian ependymin-related protein 1 [Merops nubicus]|nr:PREDICTED: mammalian ependymin-related protein 1 [Merops nubicus]